MIRSLFQIEPLLPLIDADKLILTPNNRLRNQIKLAYQAYLGDKVVRSPRIYALNEWLNLLWQTLQNSGYPPSLVCVANNMQIQTLWQQVIEEAGVETTGAGSPLERRALARQVCDAHANLHAWQQDIQKLNCDPEITAWCHSFDKKLQRQGLITPEQMQAIVLAGFREGRLSNEQEIYLHSFIDITPLAQSLLTAAARRQIHLSKQPPPNRRLLRTCAEDSEQEVKAACHWAWQTLQQDPQVSVAIIAPQLSRDRELIERLLCETFESHRFDPLTPRRPLPFNISAAQSLAGTPLIAGTLQLLELNLKQLPVQQLYAVLHSPFFGQREQEWPLRNNIVKQLIARASFAGNVNDIAQFAQRYCEGQNEATENFSVWQQASKTWLKFIELRRQYQSKTLPPSQWVMHFLQQLQCLGWPGARRLDSIEYQQVQHWYTGLEEFAAMDNVVGAIDLDSALNLLKDLAHASPFQAETRDTPVHVLGAFEAVGLHFSHCWILGVNDKEWPAPLQANPLLPKQLQSQLQMPKASLNREIEIAQQLIEHFSRAGEQVIFSHAQQVRNAQANASPLLRQLEHKRLTEIIPNDNPGLEALGQTLVQQQQLAWVDCGKGPPLHTSANAPASGGQRVFALQAQCPFNAFAELRLHATAAEQPSIGFGPKEKGIVIHNVLATVWERLQAKARLMAISDEELASLIDNSVMANCTQLGKKDAALLGDYYYQLEQRRLTKLLIQWLAWEKQRPNFTVLATEQNLQAEFAGLHVRLRIDRVDQLENGDILLLDYKTSPHTTAAWMQERPGEPQLPLYSLCYPQTVGGIGFAVISGDELGMRGVADRHDAINIDGIKSTQALKVEDWATLEKLFHQRLQHLAREIIGGDCPVMFQSGYQPSRDPLAPLNRVFERDYIRYRLQQP